MNVFKIRMMVFHLFLRFHMQNVHEIINKIPPQLTAQSFHQFSVSWPLFSFKMTEIHGS